MHTRLQICFMNETNTKYQIDICTHTQTLVVIPYHNVHAYVYIHSNEGLQGQCNIRK